MNRAERRSLKRSNLKNSNKKVISMDIKAKKVSEFKRKSAKISFYYAFIIAIIFGIILFIN